MNLLRFFCGIETGRISPPKDQFEAIDADYAKLCSQFVGNKKHKITLMNEAASNMSRHLRKSILMTLFFKAEYYRRNSRSNRNESIAKHSVRLPKQLLQPTQIW